MSKNINSKSTALEVIDGHNLTGYEVLVTGGGSGLGVETVRAFAKANARVILAARDVAKAKQVADEIIKSTGNSKVEVEQLDLASLKSVRAFVERFLAKKRPLNILVNNAGVMASPLSYTEDGFENQFGTNHLGHFVLTKGLIPALKDGYKKSGKRSRVVSLTSMGHSFSNVNFADPNFKTTPYDKWVSYGASKTANSLLAVGVYKRYKNDGITAFAVHPGVIQTPLMRHMDNDELKAYGWIDANGNKVSLPNEKTVPQGASTSVWAAVAPELEDKGGLYLNDNSIAIKRASREEIFTQFSGYLDYALSEENAEKLWNLSEQLTSK